MISNKSRVRVAKEILASAADLASLLQLFRSPAKDKCNMSQNDAQERSQVDYPVQLRLPTEGLARI